MEKVSVSYLFSSEDIKQNVIPLRCLINGGGPEGQNKWRGQRFLLDLINQGGWDLKKSVNISNE